MSKIVYKPHCERCGALIEQKIQFKRNMIKLDNLIPPLYASENCEINPYLCEICGAVFDSIEVRLPEEI